MTDAEITAALAICDDATPGPWWHGGTSIDQLSDGGAGYPIDRYTDCIEVIETQCLKCGARSPMRDADAAFIAAARTGWPAALREVQRLRLVEPRLVEQALAADLHRSGALAGGCGVEDVTTKMRDIGDPTALIPAATCPACGFAPCEPSSPDHAQVAIDPQALRALAERVIADWSWPIPPRLSILISADLNALARGVLALIDERDRLAAFVAIARQYDADYGPMMDQDRRRDPLSAAIDALAKEPSHGE